MDTFVLELQERVKKLADQLAEREIDLAVLFNPGHIRFFTDFRMNTATESILAATKEGDLFYIVPPLDYRRAQQSCWIRQLLTFPEDTPNYLSPLEKILPPGKVKRIGIEADTIAYHKLRFLQEGFAAELIPVDRELFAMRAVKTPAEIGLLRKAALIADTAMQACYEMMRPGVTEAELAGYARYLFEKYGAEGASFDPFWMSGANAWLPQRFPSAKALQKGELCIFDMGAVYRGYCSDLTRTLSLGGLNSRQLEICQAAFTAQQRAMAAIRPGVTAKAIDQIARDYIAGQGFGEYFPHITGHGLGISIHELPILDQETDTLLQENMVVTVEPGIYVPGVGAARTEDMVLVTASGYEKLTQAGYNMLRT